MADRVRLTHEDTFVPCSVLDLPRKVLTPLPVKKKNCPQFWKTSGAARHNYVEGGFTWLVKTVYVLNTRLHLPLTTVHIVTFCWKSNFHSFTETWAPRNEMGVILTQWRRASKLKEEKRRRRQRLGDKCASRCSHAAASSCQPGNACTLQKIILFGKKPTKWTTTAVESNGHCMSSVIKNKIKNTKKKPRWRSDEKHCVTYVFFRLSQFLFVFLYAFPLCSLWGM